jgi:hypothetical protein
VRQPLTLFEGKILDGRNRAEAAKRTGLLFIPIEEFEGTFEQARDYVISLNLIRRHLDTGQRAMIAAQLAKLSHGGDRSKPQNCGLPAKDAAKQLKVSTRSVETAKAVRKADPALAEEVKQGKTKLASSTHLLPPRQRDPTTLAPVQAKAPCRRYRSALRCPARKSQPDLYLYTHRREEFR